MAHDPAVRQGTKQGTTPEVRSGRRATARRAAGAPGAAPPADGHDQSRGKPHRNISKDPRWVERIALMTYWHEGRDSDRSAHEVAEDLCDAGEDISVNAVLACQQAAWHLGVVEHVVHLDRERREVHRLEQALQARYRIRRALVVPGFPDMMRDDLTADRRRSIRVQVIHKMAKAGAALLDNILAAAAGRPRDSGPYRIAIAWGRTMHAFTQQLQNTPRELPRPEDIEVLACVGITDARNPFEANILARDLASAYGSRSAQLPCLAFVRSEEYDVVTQPAKVRAMLQVLPTCDVVISSLGAIGNVDGASEITLSNDPRENEKLFSTARAAGAAGEICYWCFDRQGRAVRTPYRAIGLDLDGLRGIAATRHAVLIAGGDRHRIEALRAALLGRFASEVVTCSVTARILLGERVES